VSISDPAPYPALSFDNVSAVRGIHTVWSEATFEVAAGGIVAVLGANGAGKTTMLQMILGLIPVAHGDLRVLGGRPGQDRDKIGYVPQHYSASSGEAIRASDAVLLGLNGNRWAFGRTSREDRGRVAEVLAAVEADGFADYRLAALSGGQRQRVAIAEALVSQPAMLILDEPLAALDVRSQREIVALLARIHRDFDVTILVVAHDLNPFLSVLDSAIYLVDGRAHHGCIHDVIDEGLLTRLYGTPIEVMHTAHGGLFTRSA